ncbi:hypothetical protein AgCh_022977 [Apium graveolens]
MNLIEKVRHPESGKPAFRWLGMKQKSSNAHEYGSGSNDTMMRVFGTEIANTTSKRFTDSISNCRSSEKVHVPIYAKQINVETEDDENSSKQHKGNLPKDPECGEPALRRLVIKQNFSIGSDLYDTRRRVFGSEITNTASKRFKDNFLSKCRSSENVIMPTYAKQHNVQKENDKNSMKKEQRHLSKSFVFGNREIEATTKIIFNGIKKSETPFRLACGTDALLMVEMGRDTFPTQVFDLENNKVGLRANVDLLEEESEVDHEKNLKYQLQGAHYYDSRVKEHNFFFSYLVGGS